MTECPEHHFCSNLVKRLRLSGMQSHLTRKICSNSLYKPVPSLFRSWYYLLSITSKKNVRYLFHTNLEPYICVCFVFYLEDMCYITWWGSQVSFIKLCKTKRGNFTLPNLAQACNDSENYKTVHKM